MNDIPGTYNQRRPRKVTLDLTVIVKTANGLGHINMLPLKILAVMDADSSETRMTYNKTLVDN